MGSDFDVGSGSGNILLVGLFVVGRLVLLEGVGSAAVEEVDAGGLVATVGRGQHAVEVGSQVDLGAVLHTLGEDTGDGDADVGRGVCLRVLVQGSLGSLKPPWKVRTVANDDGVDNQRQELGLVLGRVVLEESGGVVVADGRIRGTLGVGDGGRGGDGNGRETHLDIELMGFESLRCLFNGFSDLHNLFLLGGEEGEKAGRMWEGHWQALIKRWSKLDAELSGCKGWAHTSPPNLFWMYSLNGYIFVRGNTRSQVSV